MSTTYVIVAFCVAFSPLAIGLAISAWDDHRRRKDAQREFARIVEHEAMRDALREPFRFTGRSL